MPHRAIESPVHPWTMMRPSSVTAAMLGRFEPGPAPTGATVPAAARLDGAADAADALIVTGIRLDGFDPRPEPCSTSNAHQAIRCAW